MDILYIIVYWWYEPVECKYNNLFVIINGEPCDNTMIQVSIISYYDLLKINRNYNFTITVFKRKLMDSSIGTLAILFIAPTTIDNGQNTLTITAGLLTIRRAYWTRFNINKWIIYLLVLCSYPWHTGRPL